MVDKERKHPPIVIIIDKNVIFIDIKRKSKKGFGVIRTSQYRNRRRKRKVR
jgi:hypothetical protein